MPPKTAYHQNVGAWLLARAPRRRIPTKSYVARFWRRDELIGSLTA
ncbi:hypothetical protein RTCIAT899_PB02740 (plasmid) [Rhizobium tropici CIAT 899]|nr:hypothetical protein RTCIAT899_PB02740 [Rhizobium tropici CIAT 899]